METSFMWLDSVNSTMDEVKSLIVKRQVYRSLNLASHVANKNRFLRSKLRRKQRNST